MVEATLPLAQAITKPAGPKGAMVAMTELAEWLDVYSPVPLPVDMAAREQRVGAIVKRVLKDLADLPSDLMIRAVKAVTGTHRYSTLPLPGEFRDVIAEELSLRRNTLQRLQVAAKFGKFEDTPGRKIPTDEERASVRELLRNAGLGLKADLDDEVDEPTPASQAAE